MDLSHLDETWKNTEVTDDNRSEIPDGKYLCRVEEVELKESKAGKPMLAQRLLILDGKYKGRKLFRNSMLVTEENVKYLKKDLITLGIELERLSDLPNHLNSLLDIEVQVTVKTKGEYQNVWIDKRLGVEDDEDVPF